MNMKYLFMKQQFADFKLYSLSLQLENKSKIKCRISQWNCSIKKSVFKIFAIFTEKQLC